MNQRSYVGTLKAVYFLFYTGVGVFHPYLYVYLREQGMSETAIGWASFVAPLTVMVLQPVWGSLGDLTGRPARVIQGAALGACLMGLTFLLSVPLWLYFLMVPLFFGFATAFDPLTNAAVVQQEVKNDQQGGYGNKRLWGSIGFVVGAMVAGTVTRRFEIHWLFPLYSGVMLILLIKSNWLQGLTMSPTTPSELLRGLKHALGRSRYRWLLIFLVTWSIPFSGNFVAFGWFWRDLGGTNAGIGLCWVLAASLEVPAYWLTVRYRDRLSLRWLLALSGVFAALRWMFYVILSKPFYIYFVQPLHALMFVSFSVGAVYMIHNLSDDVIRNTGQSLLSASVFGAGAALGNLLAGQIYQSTNPHLFYYYLLSINIVSVLIAIFMLKPASGTSTSVKQESAS
ncbi:MAG: MFS transporter [bacterium]